MPGFRFYEAADRRQDEIWKYTKDLWGPAQAESYIRGLHVILQQAADKKLTWKKVSPRQLLKSWPELYFVRYELHFVFFRVLPDGTLGVVSILHAAMDIPQRLLEDLELKS